MRLNIKPVVFTVVLSTSIANAADHIGNRDYRSFPGDGQPADDFNLPAYAGDNVVFYHDSTQVNISRAQIDLVVDSLDAAIDLYRDYGDSQFPKIDSCSDGFSNTASVAVIPKNPSLPAGNGCNGKAEVYPSWWNEDNFNNRVTDFRTWEIAYYEMGRGSDFSIYDYFGIGGSMPFIRATFPRFVLWSALSDLGIDHEATASDSSWRESVTPVPFKENLQNVLQNGISFIDFYDSAVAPKAVITTTNDSGQTSSINLNDALAVVFYDLRETFGHDFMVEFFNFARTNAAQLKPLDGEDVLCNIVNAGNVALNKVSNGDTNGFISMHLRNKFDFPDCSHLPINIEINTETTQLVTGLDNMISWDASGALPNQATVRVYSNVDGAGWVQLADVEFDTAEISYTVPTGASDIAIFAGILLDNRWVAVDRRDYQVVSTPTITINVPNDAISNIGHGYITWEKTFELVDAGFQLWGDFNNDTQGWLHLNGVDGSKNSAYIPLGNNDTSVNVFLGADHNGQWLTTDIETITVLDED